MRYVTNSNNYVVSISFGAEVECAHGYCKEYEGSIPSGYISLEDWYASEMDNLCRWKIVDGELTLATSAVEPVDDWEHPPLFLGVEYRTQERYLGKPVYAKLVDFGALPNTGSKNVAHATKTNQTIISLHGQLSDGVPFSTGYNMTRTSGSKKFWVDATKWNIRMLTEADMSALTAYVLVKYVKDSDPTPAAPDPNEPASSGFEAVDDGSGNVTATPYGTATITDDGAGNVTLAAPGYGAFLDSGSGNVKIK